MDVALKINSFFMHLLVSLLLVLLVRTSSYILRLPCKTNAEFRAKMRDTTIANLTAIVTLEAHDFAMCQYQCAFHKKCKSFVIDRIDTCRIFDKSFEDKRDGVSLHREQGSIYYSTFYNETKVGPVCKEKSPCATGQRCFDTCECPGWRCEDIDHCADQPCKNGGSCSSTPEGYKCTCVGIYKGLTCEDVDPCSSKPCLNGGLCVASLNGYTCMCLAGFTGPICAEFNGWMDGCAKKGFTPSGDGSMSKAACLDLCSKSSTAVTYKIDSSQCSCSAFSDLQIESGFQCTIFPKEGVSWSSACKYEDGTFYSEAFSQWYCYYHCADLHFKAATWSDSAKECRCHTEKEKTANLGSSCIEIR